MSEKGSVGKLDLPFGVDYDLVHGIMKDPQNHIVRLASSMRGHYKDEKALEAQIAARAIPCTTRSSRCQIPEQSGSCSSASARPTPGTVGGECFMTKGHYHTVAATAEIYLCLRGEGYMLMKLADGTAARERFLPGRMVVRAAALGAPDREHRRRAPDQLLRVPG